jgi:murein L,D-transpeptidase YafK
MPKRQITGSVHMARRLLMILTALILIAGVSSVAWRAYRTEKFYSLPVGAIADRIVVRKSRREMTIFHAGEPLKTYIVALGPTEPGPKQREGDKKTPEGLYRISGRNPKSCCHLSLRTSYPEPRDIALAKERGEPPGGDIMIHGLPNGFGGIGTLHRLHDWTAGCIGVTDQEIEELWRVVADGTPIEILP